MLESCANRSKYWYDYHEYLFAKFIYYFCRCCKNKQCYQRRHERLQRHRKATRHLESELDIINVMRTNRLSKFLINLNLRKQQRDLIDSFREYQIDDLRQGEAKRADSEV